MAKTTKKVEPVDEEPKTKEATPAPEPKPEPPVEVPHWVVSGG